MDPLTITVGLASLLVSVGKIITCCNDFYSRYKLAGDLLPSIAAECNLISLALSKAHSLLNSSPERYKGKDDLLGVLQNCLAGCSVVLSMLCEEIGISHSQKQGENGSANCTYLPSMAQYAWNETRARDLLVHLRGQQVGLTLILTILQTQSMDDVFELVQSNTRYLAKLAQRAKSLASSSAEAESRSVFRFSTASDISSTRFVFDDQLTSAEPYRRFLHQYQKSQECTACAMRAREAIAREAIARSPSPALTLANRQVPSRDRPSVASHTTKSSSAPSDPFADDQSTQLLRKESEISHFSNMEQLSVYTGDSESNDIFDAIRTKDYDRLQSLIDRGIDLSIRNRGGHSALSEAVHLGDADACQRLIQGGAGRETPCYAKACKRARPLHIAAMVNSVEVMKVLLQHSAKVGSISQDNCTALHWAAEHDSPEAAQFLISHGLDPTVNDSNANTPLHIAAMYRSGAFVKFYLSHDQVSAKELLQLKNADGKTPTNLAILSWGAVGLQLLMSYGANVDSRDSEGATLLHYAARQSCHESVHNLDAAGLDVNARDSKGQTPLHDAVLSEFDSRRTIRLLLDLGGDLEARTDDKAHSEFLEARVLSQRDLCESDEEQIIGFARVEPRESGLRGLTPLLLAAKSSTATVIQSLLDAGADIGAASSCGCSALKLSKMNKDPDVFKVLLKHLTPPKDHTTLPLQALAFSVASEEDFDTMHNAKLKTLGLKEGIRHRKAGAEIKPDSCGYNTWPLSLVKSALVTCDRSCVSIHAEFNGRSALSLASQNGLDAILKVLLAHDSSAELVREIEGVLDWLPRLKRGRPGMPPREENRTLHLLATRHDELTQKLGEKKAKQEAARKLQESEMKRIAKAERDEAEKEKRKNSTAAEMQLMFAIEKNPFKDVKESTLTAEQRRPMATEKDKKVPRRKFYRGKGSDDSQARG